MFDLSFDDFRYLFNLAKIGLLRGYEVFLLFYFWWPEAEEMVRVVYEMLS